MGRDSFQRKIWVRGPKKIETHCYIGWCYNVLLNNNKYVLYSLLERKYKEY